MIEYKGKLYVRVSHVLSRYKNFGGASPEQVANKARIGTSAHQAISDYIEGDLPCPLPAALGYFRSFLQWHSTVKPEFLPGTETRYYDDKLQLTGCIDALALLPGDQQPLLVDWKTSYAEDKEVWPMQAHLYHYLLEKNGVTVGPRFLFVKLDKNGDVPRVYSYPYSSNTRAKCMQAVSDYWSEKENSSS